MSRGALQKLNRRSRYEKWTKLVLCTQSKKGSENRSSRFEPKILWISFSRGSGPPLNDMSPKELDTVPDWNLLPKQITSLTGTTQHAGTGSCVPYRGPVPTSPHIGQLVVEELQIIADTIPHPARLIRTSLGLHLGHKINGRLSIPTSLAPECGCQSSAVPCHPNSTRFLKLEIICLPTLCIVSKT